MSKIDEIRAKLEVNDILSSGAIDEIIEIIAPYLSHGITEEEARRWFNNLSYNPNQLEFMMEGKELGLITSSREPIAEPESLVKAREAYYAERKVVPLTANLFIIELEARVKQLEGK